MYLFRLQKFDCFQTLIIFPVTSHMLESSFNDFPSVSLTIFFFTEDFYLLRWIRDQQESEGVTPGGDVYIILRLDGRVRRSGKVRKMLETFATSFWPEIIANINYQRMSQVSLGRVMTDCCFLVFSFLFKNLDQLAFLQLVFSFSMAAK